MTVLVLWQYSACTASPVPRYYDRQLRAAQLHILVPYNPAYS